MASTLDGFVTGFALGENAITKGRELELKRRADDRANAEFERQQDAFAYENLGRLLNSLGQKNGKFSAANLNNDAARQRIRDAINNDPRLKQRLGNLLTQGSHAEQQGYTREIVDMQPGPNGGMVPVIAWKDQQGATVSQGPMTKNGTNEPDDQVVSLQGGDFIKLVHDAAVLNNQQYANQVQQAGAIDAADRGIATLGRITSANRPVAAPATTVAPGATSGATPGPGTRPAGAPVASAAPPRGLARAADTPPPGGLAPPIPNAKERFVQRVLGGVLSMNPLTAPVGSLVLADELVSNAVQGTAPSPPAPVGAARNAVTEANQAAAQFGGAPLSKQEESRVVDRSLEAPRQLAADIEAAGGAEGYLKKQQAAAAAYGGGGLSQQQVADQISMLRSGAGVTTGNERSRLNALASELQAVSGIPAPAESAPAESAPAESAPAGRPPGDASRDVVPPPSKQPTTQQVTGLATKLVQRGAPRVSTEDDELLRHLVLQKVLPLEDYLSIKRTGRIGAKVKAAVQDALGNVTIINNDGTVSHVANPFAGQIAALKARGGKGDTDKDKDKALDTFLQGYYPGEKGAAQRRALQPLIGSALSAQNKNLSDPGIRARVGRAVEAYHNLAPKFGFFRSFVNGDPIQSIVPIMQLQQASVPVEKGYDEFLIPLRKRLAAVTKQSDVVLSDEQWGRATKVYIAAVKNNVPPDKAVEATVNLILNQQRQPGTGQ